MPKVVPNHLAVSLSSVSDGKPITDFRVESSLIFNPTLLP